MPARARLFQRLRRSVLGAWFAAAYALTVLALALAPTPSVAFGLPGGVLLCSGVPAPDGRSEIPATPLGDLAHCKGCPHNPVLGAPPVLAALLVARPGVRQALSRQWDEEQLSVAATGLPPSRAPPAI
ncbi:hypothetical protein [Bosea sp. TAB14]|uniref:hypothetical protein n=1 Tax=Bosea sp. TAB14 TaxID=3237481 RepID=UPI003F8E0AE7